MNKQILLVIGFTVIALVAIGADCPSGSTPQSNMICDHKTTGTTIDDCDTFEDIDGTCRKINSASTAPCSSFSPVPNNPDVCGEGPDSEGSVCCSWETEYETDFQIGDCTRVPHPTDPEAHPTCRCVIPPGSPSFSTTIAMCST